MRRILLIFLLLTASVFGKNLWITQAGTGTGTGLTPGNSASAAFFNAGPGTNWGGGAGQIGPADTVVRMGAFTSRLTVGASGTSTSARMTITGDSTNPGGGSALNGTDSGPGIDLNGKNNIAIVDCIFTQPTNPTTYAVITCSTSGSTGILIQDNYTHDTYSQFISDTSAALLTSSIIRYNTCDNIFGTGSGVSGGGLTVIDVQNGNTNLIEYNIITKSLDRVQAPGNSTVVRNNYWGATDTFLYPSSSQYPWHVDGYSNFGAGAGSRSKYIYEANYDTDNADSVGDQPAGTTPNGHSKILQNTGAGTISQFIDRFNLDVREAQTRSIYAGITDVWSYNNNSVAAATGYTTVSGRTNIAVSPGNNNLETYQSATVAVTRVNFLNNTYCFTPSVTNNSGGQGGIFYLLGLTPAVSRYDALHAFNAAPATGGQPAYPAGATNSLAQTTPGFTDGTGAIGHDDYTLTSGALLRGAGKALTTASGAGVATATLVVVDAKGLTDGWSVPGVEADWIKIGSGAYVQISSINYGTNTVTLSAARSWSNADNVIVKGMEDVGALPFTYTPASQTVTGTNTTATASPTALTATTTTTEGVRFAEFWWTPQGGIGLPVGQTFYNGTNSYSFTYTPSGRGTASVFMYSKWAANTAAKLRSVVSSLLINQDPTVLANGSATSTTIPLTWTDNSGGVDTYSIETSLDNVTFTVNNVTTAGAVSGTATGLASSTLYYARVRALVGGVYSGPSNTVSTTTASAGGSSAAGVGGRVTIGGKVTIK